MDALNRIERNYRILCSSHIIASHPNLHSVVKEIEILETSAPNGLVRLKPHFAQGTPGLIFHQGDNPLLLFQDNHPIEKPKILGQLTLFGQITRPTMFKASGCLNVIVVHFHPEVIKILYGIPASELLDQFLDFTFLRLPGSTDLIDKLQHCTPILGQLSLLLHYISENLVNSNLVEKKNLSHTIKMLTNEDLHISLGHLSTQLNCSQRTLQRKFLDHVGVTPQQYQRICKFNRAIGQINTGTFESLTMVAHNYGFSDQSHFTRTFKEFTGVTPSQYINSLGLK